MANVKSPGTFGISQICSVHCLFHLSVRASPDMQTSFRAPNSSKVSEGSGKYNSHLECATEKFLITLSEKNDPRSSAVFWIWGNVFFFFLPIKGILYEFCSLSIYINQNSSLVQLFLLCIYYSLDILFHLFSNLFKFGLLINFSFPLNTFIFNIQVKSYWITRMNSMYSRQVYELQASELIAILLCLYTIRLHVCPCNISLKVKQFQTG